MSPGTMLSAVRMEMEVKESLEMDVRNGVAGRDPLSRRICLEDIGVLQPPRNSEHLVRCLCVMYLQPDKSSACDPEWPTI